MVPYLVVRILCGLATACRRCLSLGPSAPSLRSQSLSALYTGSNNLVTRSVEVGQVPLQFAVCCFVACEKHPCRCKGAPKRLVESPCLPARLDKIRCRACSAEESQASTSGADGDNHIEMKGIRLSGVPLYLDMQATTPLDPRVLDAMLPYLTEQYGNPHSRTHMYGWESEEAVEVSRKQV